MKKFGFLFVSVLLLSLALAACTPTPTPTPVFTDEKQPVSVNVGQQFVVELESNPTTGFIWTATFDAKVLSQVSKDYTASPAAPGLVGSGGKDKFTFKAVAAGTTDLTFGYHRSNESVPYAQTKIFKVTVK